MWDHKILKDTEAIILVFSFSPGLCWENRGTKLGTWSGEREKMVAVCHSSWKCHHQSKGLGQQSTFHPPVPGVFAPPSHYGKSNAPPCFPLGATLAQSWLCWEVCWVSAFYPSFMSQVQVDGLKFQQHSRMKIENFTTIFMNIIIDLIIVHVCEGQGDSLMHAVCTEEFEYF